MRGDVEEGQGRCEAVLAVTGGDCDRFRPHSNFAVQIVFRLSDKLR